MTTTFNPSTIINITNRTQNLNPKFKRSVIYGGARQQTNLLIIHHTLGGSLDGAVITLQKRGFSYHYIVDRDGKVYSLVPDNLTAFHIEGANASSVSISLVGNTDPTETNPERYLQRGERPVRFTQEQLDISLALGNYLLQKYPNITMNGVKYVYGHGETTTKKASTEGLYIARALRGTNTAAIPYPPPFIAQNLPPNPSLPGGYLGGSQSAPRIRTRSRPTTQSNITPYIGSLESFHPNIQYELTRRRFASNTAQVHTPFVKLTSLMYVTGSNLTDGGDKPAWCPTLGVHEKQDLTFEDIYKPATNGRSIVGYATSIKDNNPIRVPVLVDSNDANLDQPNIPPPGIVSMTTERSTAGPMGVRGGLFRATIKITAYSVGQLNALMKYFMRPATRVVMEYGRYSSEQPIDTITPYNWVADKSVITDDPEKGFRKLISLQASQQAFIQQYVYNNFGNYEIFIGYVTKFALKYTKNNTFEIDLTVHSVQQFEIPTKYSGAKPLCRTGNAVDDPCKVMDVAEYFDAASSWKENSFDAVLAAIGEVTPSEGKFTDSAYINDLKDEWASHVIPIRTTNPTTGGAGRSGANNPTTGTGMGGHFVSWKFFVNVILNDTKYGLMSLFNTDGMSADYIRSNFIKPLGNRGSNPTNDRNLLLADEVGYHPALRSTNAGVMIIYNSGQDSQSQAALTRIQAIDRALNTTERDTYTPIDLTDDTIYNEIANNTEVGDFKSTEDTSFLTKGVWINTNAIKQAFSGADTVSAGISNLLGYMNASVGGYWNLQLLSNDVERPGLHVIDTLPKFSDTSTEPQRALLSPISDSIITSRAELERPEVPQTVFGSGTFRKIKIGPTQELEIPQPKYLYMFNRKTRQLTDDDTGSELLDINITFDLPQVIAAQAIANIGGVAQRGTLNAIDINELKSLSLMPEIYAKCNPASTTDVCPGDNEPLVPVATPPWVGTPLASGGTPAQSPVGPQQPRQTAFSGFSSFNNNFNLSGGVFDFGAQQERAAQDAQNQITQNPNTVSSVREYGNLGQALKLIELNPPTMIREFDRTSGDTESKDKVHPFNSSNLTKSIVDLTLPGIGGIQLFQSFAVDRIPQILKRGIYVVTKISHEFTVQNGWVTKIQGRFRYRPNDNE